MDIKHRSITELYLPVVLVITAVITETFAQQQFTKAQYTMKPVPSSTDLSGAVKTFPNTRSTVECGVKCSQYSLEAFFFVKQTAMCYCSDYVDVADEPNPEEGHIKYGYIANAAKSTPMFPSCGTASSSWTTFQRRMNGSVDFYRNWTEYVNGFGRSDGEFWLGLEEIHQNTAAGCELCIYLEAGPNPESTTESGFAMYSNFSVGSAATDYRLQVDGFSGSPDIGDSLVSHSGYSFTTYDNDNDAWPVNCAEYRQGGWWYTDCALTNLNGLYNTGTQTTPDAIFWNHPWGRYFGLKISKMSYRCV